MAEYIEREAAIAVVKKYFENLKLNHDICTDGIRSLPAADVQPIVHGDWVKIIYQDGSDVVCSRCGYNTGFWRFFNFCPKCGADMRIAKKPE